MKKKLYCLTVDKKVLGLCRGLADSFDVDVNIIRVLMFFICLSGFGLIVYIALGMLLPKSDVSDMFIEGKTAEIVFNGKTCPQYKTFNAEEAMFCKECASKLPEDKKTIAQIALLKIRIMQNSACNAALHL